MVIVTIADISLVVDDEEIESSQSILRKREGYEKFIALDTESVYIHFMLSNLKTPLNGIYKYHFDSSGLWELYYNNRNDFRIEFKKGPDGVALAFIDVNLTKRNSTIYHTEDGRRDLENRLLPFVYPVDEVIFINLLPSCNGILVHACGIDDNGRGFLFLGTSGAGKSTTARLWSGEAGATVLSDDRIIIRESNDTFLAYGTPWHGEVNICDPGKVGMEKIFFLEHSDKNYAKPLSAVDAATRMLVRCFPPFWDKEGMEFTLSFIERIVRNIPCCELGFVPDKSAVSFVRGLR